MSPLTIKVGAESASPPERVLAAAYDFSDRRERVWPNVKTKHLQVHANGGLYAEVTEATWVAGLFWERCRYDWSRPGVVTATVVDSNVYVPGVSSFELAATARDGGSHVEMTLTREFKRGPKGRAATLLYRVGGRRLFGSMLRSVVAAVDAVRSRP